MEKRMAKPAHKGISRIVTIIFTLIFSLFVFSFLTNHTVLNEAFTQSILDKPSNQDKIVQEMRKIIHESASSTGLPDAVTDNLIEDRTIEKVVHQTVANLYKNKKNPVPTELITTQMSEKIDTTLSSTLGFTSTPLVTQATSNLKNYIDENVQPTGNEVGQRLTEIRQTVHWVMIISAILSVVLALILLFINHSLLRGWWYVGWGLTFTGLLDLLLSFMIKANSQVPFTSVAYNQYFQDIVHQWLDTAANKFIQFSSIILGIGILCVLVFGFLKPKNRKE